jgi:hypothetical protein
VGRVGLSELSRVARACPRPRSSAIAKCRSCAEGSRTHGQRLEHCCHDHFYLETNLCQASMTLGCAMMTAIASTPPIAQPVEMQQLVTASQSAMGARVRAPPQPLHGVGRCDGKVHGRSSLDTKCGTAASVWTYIYLHRLQPGSFVPLTGSAVRRSALRQRGQYPVPLRTCVTRQLCRIDRLSRAQQSCNGRHAFTVSSNAACLARDCSRHRDAGAHYLLSLFHRHWCAGRDCPL